MDPTIRGLIDEVVGEWTNASRIFTAFEVTLELKNRGAQVRHRELKSDIHAAIERVAGPSYTRTLMDVGAPVDAFVYHPSGAAPTSYQPLVRNDPPPIARTASAARSTSSPSQNDPQTVAESDETVDAETDGGLRVPARFLRQMGQSPGDSVEVRFLEYDEQIELTGRGPGEPADTIVVDGDGTAKVTSQQLERVGLEGLEKYQISGTPHAIAISGY